MRTGTTAFALAAALLSLAPAAAMASSTPTPETLKAALAEPPSADYVEATPGTGGVLEGTFDAQTYVKTTTDSAKQAAFINEFATAGFVTGYGRAWVRKGSGSVLVEDILVFNDNQGATAIFGTSKLGDLSNPAYRGSLDTSSIPHSYGVKDVLGSAYLSGAVWVKGNDMLLVVLVSSAGYPDQAALDQIQKENSTAPDYTIQPPAVSQPSQSANTARIVAIAGIVVVVLALIAAAFLLLNRSRRSRQVGVAAAAAAQPPPVSMSPDGRYWWDGRAWQDVNVSPPPSAPRSPDGAFWWDGSSWRPMPRGYS